MMHCDWNVAWVICTFKSIRNKVYIRNYIHMCILDNCTIVMTYNQKQKALQRKRLQYKLCTHSL